MSAKSEPAPNFTLILRAYDGRITGAVVDREIALIPSRERELVDGEAEAAQGLIAIFAGERTMRQDADGDTPEA